MVAGAVGLNDRELGYNIRFVYPRLGIGELSAGLARAVPQIELGRAPARHRLAAARARLRGRDRALRRARLRRRRSPCCSASAATCRPRWPRRAARLRCTHLYYLDVALNGPCQKPLHWVYVPEARYPFYRVGCYSNFSAAMAPPGKANLYVELADRREPDLGTLVPEVAAGLVEMGLIDVPGGGALRAAAPHRSRLRDLRPLRTSPRWRPSAPSSRARTSSPPGATGAGTTRRWRTRSASGATAPPKRGGSSEEPHERPGQTGPSPSSPSDQPRPKISIVIPVYNEEGILHAAIVDLRERLAPLGWSYEIVLAENGSRDETLVIASELHQQVPRGALLLPGRAQLRGRAPPRHRGGARRDRHLRRDRPLRHRLPPAARSSCSASGKFDMVIGSKLTDGSRDDRPFTRHAASQLYNGLLRYTLGFRGTDTHGLKAFVRAPLLPIARACVVEKDVFASEFVIRAYRAGLRVREIPVRVLEKRPPSINLFKRVPNVLKSLAKLTYAIRVKG